MDTGNLTHTPLLLVALTHSQTNCLTSYMHKWRKAAALVPHN
jgi:hypothetical protein